MKFKDTLKELEAKASEGPFIVRGNDGLRQVGIHGKYSWLCEGMVKNDANLIVYLCNHAQEIINLVEAAEKISANIADSSSLRVWFEDLIALKNTLAALNKEPPKEIDPNKWAFDRKLESY